MMEKEETENVFKRRSYRSCISSAYHDVKDNLWTITKKNWRIFLFIAVLQAAISTWNASLSLGINYEGFDMKPIPLTVCGLLAVASDLLLMAAAFRIVNGRALAWNIRRAFSTLPATILFTLACGIVLLIAFVAYAMSSKTPENIPVWHLANIAQEGEKARDDDESPAAEGIAVGRDENLAQLRFRLNHVSCVDVSHRYA